MARRAPPAARLLRYAATRSFMSLTLSNRLSGPKSPGMVQSSRFTISSKSWRPVCTTPLSKTLAPQRLEGYFEFMKVVVRGHISPASSGLSQGSLEPFAMRAPREPLRGASGGPVALATTRRWTFRGGGCRRAGGAVGSRASPTGPTGLAGGVEALPGDAPGGVAAAVAAQASASASAMRRSASCVRPQVVRRVCKNSKAAPPPVASSQVGPTLLPEIPHPHLAIGTYRKPRVRSWLRSGAAAACAARRHLALECGPACRYTLLCLSLGERLGPHTPAEAVWPQTPPRVKRWQTHPCLLLACRARALRS